ncbi:putative T6SS immunity periplasmic lipoprotein [Rosenbergiella australiborealis]|uniref:Lipoprotein n=1 Tax=Rosenbergiella australiborealis TaxID=1544696 RepID=A0ABS5T4A6_9GAMM|nr:putative T6SS immunity periplasmic lipoprotein [Rosenbergiella australiborealis]MBT0727171.1 hypothetical protein [Rosenbergiella australiborealis]
MRRSLLLLALTLLLVSCHLPRQYLLPLKVVVENNSLCFSLPPEVMNHHGALYYAGASISLREEEGWRVLWQSSLQPPLSVIPQKKCFDDAPINWRAGTYSLLVVSSTAEGKVRHRFEKTFTLTQDRTGHLAL